MNLILASSNRHKLEEIEKLLPSSFKLTGLSAIGINEPIPETGNTFTANALEKARFIFNKFHLPVIADDSGLEVRALQGRPGVFSARYNGINATDSENVTKLLNEMEGILDRRARFVAAIALIVNGVEYVFEGFCEGNIATEKAGSSGFGYDPVFIPNGYKQTFAELSADVKNEVGHRGKAIRKLVLFLKDSA